MWLTTSHIGATSVLGLFLLALCTSVFYGVILWTVYLALEPYVRRHWPRTLISWSRLLAGQWRDPIVGRDVLIGAALGVSWTLIGRVLDLIQGGLREPSPTWTDENLLLGTRDAIGEWLARGPHHLRDGLLFFSLLFLLRVLLRNQWLAAAGFSLLLTIPFALQGDAPIMGVVAGLLIYGLAAVVVLRFGLLALTVGFCISGLIGPPLSLHTNAWYFGNIAFLFASAILLSIWAFFTSVGGRRFWNNDLLR
jgi:serine/threonine-protein kinase